MASSLVMKGYMHDIIMDNGDCRVTVKLDNGLPYDAYVFNWRGIDKFQNEFMFVIGGMNITISSEYYQAIKNRRPVILQLWLSHIGRMSLNYHHIEVDKETNHILSSMDVFHVCMNKVTRKSAPLPEWYKEKYGPYANGPVAKVMKKLEKVKEVYKYTGRVQYHDIDYYNHTSYKLYLKLCSNCAHSAVADGFFTKVTDDFALYQVKHISTLYLSETNVNDELIVDTWEDENNNDTVHFIISKTDTGKEVFHCTIRLYSQKNYNPYMPGLRDGKSKL
ncbi:uncharacterized protein LOC144351924 [Saccoglossus kowalevskii]